MNHTGAFRLMDLPLEVLLKVLIFLDVPDLTNLSKTCVFLRNVSNERFVTRCRLIYTRERIDYLLKIRPDTDLLFEKHILPSKGLNYNPDLLSTATTLQRNLRRDSLHKELRKRPSIKELREKRIVKKPEGVVDDIKSRLQTHELSEMLQLLLKSWRFQKKDLKRGSLPLIESDLDREFLDVYEHVLNAKVILAKERQKKKRGYNDYNEFVTKVCSMSGADSGPVSPVMSRISSRETVDSMDHGVDEDSATVSKIVASNTLPASTVSSADQPSSVCAYEINLDASKLMHEDTTFQNSTDSKFLNITERSASLNTARDKLHHVKMRKKFFEDLASNETPSQHGRLVPNPVEKVLNHIELGCNDDRRPRGKPSRTTLKALVNDNVIHYEKVS